MSKPEPFDLIDADTYVDEPPRDEVTSLRARVDHAEHVAAIAEFNEKAALRHVAALDARVAKLEAALTKISTVARKDASLAPEDPLLVFIVGVVDAALSETVEA